MVNYDNIFTIFSSVCQLLSRCGLPGSRPPGGADPPPGRHSRAGYVRHPAPARSSRPPHQGPPAPVLPRPAGLVQSQWHHAVCAAAKVQQPSLAAGISPQGGKALRTGKAVLEQAVINAGCSLRPQQHRCSQRGSICGKARVSSRYKFLTTAQLCILIPRDAKLIFPAGNLAAAALQKSRNAASHTGLHCVTVTRPPAMAAAAA